MTCGRSWATTGRSTGIYRFPRAGSDDGGKADLTPLPDCARSIQATQLRSGLLEFLHELPQLVRIDVADRVVVEAVRAPAADVVALR
jgi:hypothetical protein